MHGANKSLIDLIEGLKKYNIESIVFCPGFGQITQDLKDRNIKFKVIPFKNWMTRENNYSVLNSIKNLIINLIYIPNAVFEAKKEKIDLIYTNSSCTPFGLFMSKIMNIPHFWHVREFGFNDFNLKYDLGRNFFNFCLNKSDEVIAISKSIRWEVLGRVNKKVHIVHNGVLSLIKIKQLNKDKEKILKDKKDITFCIIGQISAKKNQEDAINAIEILKYKYPDINLIVVGDYNNDYGYKLIRMTSNLNIKKEVLFKGYRKNVFEFLLKSDVYLMCSKNEAMGRVTAEAMAAGIPVIGFNNGGTVEIIQDGIDGLLYKGDANELALKMEYLILNKEKRKEMGKNAILNAEKNFSIDLYAKNIFNILKKYNKNYN